MKSRKATVWLARFGSGLFCSMNTFWNLKVDYAAPSVCPSSQYGFKGTSETGGRILVRLWQHRIWFVRLDSSINNFISWQQSLLFTEND